MLHDAFIALSIMDPLAHQQNQYKLDSERPSSRSIDAGASNAKAGGVRNRPAFSVLGVVRLGPTDRAVVSL